MTLKEYLRGIWPARVSKMQREDIKKHKFLTYILEIMAKIETQDRVVQRIILDAGTYALIKHYGRHGYLPAANSEQIERGHLGYYYNAELWVNKNFKEPVAIAEPLKHTIGCFMPIGEEPL